MPGDSVPPTFRSPESPSETGFPSVVTDVPGTLADPTAGTPHFGTLAQAPSEVPYFGTVVQTPQQQIRVQNRDTPEIPGYEIISKLGQGGMGVVWLARQIKVNRRVALKMILGDPGAEDRARFQTEAETIAGIDHPNVIKVFDVGEVDGKPYFALEFAPGGSLSGQLDGVPLKAIKAAEMIEKLARGMAAAHIRGVIHRDLKPQNVLLSEDGEPKITDFGLAKRLDSNDGQTKTGAIMGTPSYMAPEQASGKIRELGTATDVYSLGAMLYELLTGRPPFRGATILDTLEQIRTTEAASIRSLNPQVPADLETICARCLRKEAAKRYRDAGELAEDLHRFLTDRPILARPVGSLERTAKWIIRNKALAAGMFIAFVSMLIGTGLSLWQREKALESLGRETKARETESRALVKVQEALETAQVQRNQARAQLLRAERFRYTALIARARRALENNEIDDALDTLEECRPDLRGWEHHFLWTTCHRRMQVYRGQRGRIFKLVFSPDGRFLASLGVDGSIFIREPATGVEHPPIHRENSKVTGLTYHPGGGQFITVWSDGALRTHSATDGKVLREWAVSPPANGPIEFTPDGRTLRIGTIQGVRSFDAANPKTGIEPPGVGIGPVTALLNVGEGWAEGYANGNVRVRDGSGTILDEFTPTDQPILHLSISPDQTRLLIAFGAIGVAGRDLKNRRSLVAAPGNSNRVYGGVFAPDGRSILVFGQRGRAELFDPATQQLLESYPFKGGEIFSAVFHPSGRYLAAGDSSGVVRILNLNPETAAATYFGHEDEVDSVCFHPGTDRIFSGGDDQRVHCWDVESGLQKQILEPRHNFWVWRVESDRHHLLSTGMGEIHFHNPETGKLLFVLNTPTKLKMHYSVALDPTGELFAVRLSENDVQIGRLQSRKIEFTIPLYGHGDLAFSPDGRSLIAGGFQQTILIDTRTGLIEKSLPGQNGLIRSVACDPTGTWIAGGIGDAGRAGEILLWEKATGQVKVRCRGHSDGVRHLCFTADGRRLISSSWDNTIRFWDVTTGEERFSLRGHSSGVLGLALDASNGLLASASKDKTAKIWDARMSQDVRILTQDLPLGCTVTFDSAGQRVILTPPHGEVRAWDFDSGLEVAPPWGDRIASVAPDHAISSDGSRFAWVDGVLVIGKRPGTIPANLARSVFDNPATDILWHTTQRFEAEKKKDPFAVRFHQAEEFAARRKLSLRNNQFDAAGWYFVAEKILRAGMKPEIDSKKNK